METHNGNGELLGDAAPVQFQLPGIAGCTSDDSDDGYGDILRDFSLSCAWEKHQEAKRRMAEAEREQRRIREAQLERDRIAERDSQIAALQAAIQQASQRQLASIPLPNRIVYGTTTSAGGQLGGPYPNSVGVPGYSGTQAFPNGTILECSRCRAWYYAAAGHLCSGFSQQVGAAFGISSAQPLPKEIETPTENYKNVHEEVTELTLESAKESLYEMMKRKLGIK